MIHQNVNLEHTPNIFLKRLGAAFNGLKQKITPNIFLKRLGAAFNGLKKKISQRKSFKKKAQTKTVSDVNFHLFGKIYQEWIKKSWNNYSRLKI